MGQKVNPHGLRVGVIKDWDSRWFTSKREFGDTLVEDYKIRKVLKKQLYNAGVPKIEIERTIDNATSKPRIRVTIHCAKPGMVIGRQGAEKEKIQAQLSKMTGKDVLVNIVEVNNMSTNAQLVAEDIASQLERRIAFRRATKMAMRNAMSPRRGSGADIDYGFAEADTTYGKIGIKVWIYKGEVLKGAKPRARKEGGNK